MSALQLSDPPEAQLLLQVKVVDASSSNGPQPVWAGLIKKNLRIRKLTGQGGGGGGGA